jgi:hypothetical protein
MRPPELMRPTELMRMEITLNQYGNALGHLQIALTQWDTTPFGKRDDLDEGPWDQAGIRRKRNQFGLDGGVDRHLLKILHRNSLSLIAAARLSCRKAVRSFAAEEPHVRAVGEAGTQHLGTCLNARKDPTAQQSAEQAKLAAGSRIVDAVGRRSTKV